MSQFMFNLILAKHSSKLVHSSKRRQQRKEALVNTVMSYLQYFCDTLNSTGDSTSHRNLTKQAAKLQRKR